MMSGRKGGKSVFATLTAKPSFFCDPRPWHDTPRPSYSVGIADLWGRIIGGVAGLAMGGPLGAIFGAAMGRAAEFGNSALGGAASGMGAFGGRLRFMSQARLAGRDQVFAMAVVVLSAKLAKCDGPVNRHEIDAFKRSFRIQPESVRDIGRLFDSARDNADPGGPYADELGTAFTDNHGMLEDVLAALFALARADAVLNKREEDFLIRVWQGFKLDQSAWDRASGAAPRRPAQEAGGEDPYAVLGVAREATPEVLRASWKQLMRENHPDSLASRGVPAEFIARASDKVARINAAWDRIKRERGL
jgi:DnaJ like chaperone protein